MARKTLKRRITKVAEENNDEDKSQILLQKKHGISEHNLLQKINNEEEDSTDDDSVDQSFNSDDSDVLEFETDDENELNLGISYETSDNFSDIEVSESNSTNENGEDRNLVKKDMNLITGVQNRRKLITDKNIKGITKDLILSNLPKTLESNGNVDSVGTIKPTIGKKKKSTRSKLKRELKSSSGNDEYVNTDTSDEEDIRNTVGNIPVHWYDEYKHIGYDWDGKKIIKPAKGDQIDNFLRKIEDPNFWSTVRDPQTGQEVVLTDADIELIKRINGARIPSSSHNDYEPWIEWFTSEVEKMPIKNVPDHKRSFLPSVSEKKRISRMVHALKMGWMKTIDEVEREKQLRHSGPKFYMLWETDTSREDVRRIHDPVLAPKRELPGHAESYNPPSEYLFDEKERKEWLKLKEEPHKRKLHFIPEKYKSLREVPAYPRYLRERFLRCLDLYLCPRAKRMKLNIDAEYLIPKLPSPKDLQPFPTVESLVYRGHNDLVRSVSVEPKGEYIVTGSDDKTIKIWEVATGRCIRTIQTDDVVRCVAWCPNVKLSIIAVACGSLLLLINPKVGDKIISKKTDDLLSKSPNNDTMESERVKTAVQWMTADHTSEQEKGVRLIITHFKPIRQVTWHGRGDYLATVMPEGANRSTIIHQLSKRRSQIPFSKSKGLIQCVLFHPVKPCLFVATQHNIRIYDLVKQELIKKLLTNSKWISNMSIHPKGDNLLVSTFDKKILWFDLDLSTKPYQTMRLHKNAVRGVAFHMRYPLFASGSDDQTVIVSHGMVYSDLLQNPLIVPLKKLQTHEKLDEFGVLDVVWHPVQPWVFSTGADATVRLYT